MRRSLIDNKKNIILNLYNSGKTILEISKIVKHDRLTVTNLLKGNNINIRNLQSYNTVSQEKINQIIPLYEKYKKLDYVAKELGISRWFVTKYLEKNNIDINRSSNNCKYSVDENFFKNIDTEEKAYFLGLIAADGCVSFRKGSHILSIGLVNDDIKILEQMKKSMNSTNPIHTYKRNGNNRDFSNFSIINSKIYSDLNKLGIIERKSLTLKFPTFEQVPENLIHHFIRGYFDGDGCVTNAHKYNDKYYPAIKFCGTKEFLESLRLIFQKYGIILNRKLSKRHKNNTNNYSLEFSGFAPLKIFYNHVYKNAEIFLDRKKSKIENYFK